MKYMRLTQSMLILAVLAVSQAYAADEYPAANFQPKVIFSSEPETVSHAAAAPTAAPCEAKTAEVVAEVDPKYPAASFQPKVIYSSDAAR